MLLLAIASLDYAWPVVTAYDRPWQMEMCFRTCKSHLGLESPRLWSWENRLKLLLMASLVHALLLSPAHSHPGSADSSSAPKL